MIVSRPLKPREIRPWLSHIKKWPLQQKNANHSKRRRACEVPRLPPQNRSLLEELFPEEPPREEVAPAKKGLDVPRLRLPEIEDVFQEVQEGPDTTAAAPQKVTNRGAVNAVRQQQLAVLMLRLASKSLVEDDFQRIAPKGKHIKDWIGPGGFLKVIPARDPSTLEQAGFYFVLFANASYARIYQSRAQRLHRMTTTYTPTSVESPIPLQPGVVIEGEDAHALMQDYTLCPPSPRIDLKLLSQYYSSKTKGMLQRGGYRQLVEGEVKTGRCVLFWVDGQFLTANVIRNTIAADGRDRGLAWNLKIEKVDRSMSSMDEGADPEISDPDVGAELDSDHHTPSRWLLSFTDENEARGFIRVWHKRHLPWKLGEDPKLVHAEFTW